MNELKAWWSATSIRERRLVIVCAVVLLVGMIYWGGLKPLSERGEQAQTRIVSEKQLLTWVVDKANKITTLRGQGGRVTRQNQPLNQVISSSAQRLNVELIRMQPRDDMLQVWVQPVAFNTLVNWLAELKEKQGIDVLFLDITRSDKSGMVEVNRLQFKRG